MTITSHEIPGHIPGTRVWLREWLREWLRGMAQHVIHIPPQEATSSKGHRYERSKDSYYHVRFVPTPRRPGRGGAGLPRSEELAELAAID